MVTPVPGPEQAGVLTASIVTQDRDNEIRSEVKLLRDQVDVLQIQASEKRSPWYRQPSTLISVVALTISTIGGLVGWWQQHKEKLIDQTQTDLTTLQRITLDLVDLHKAVLDNQIADPVHAFSVNSILNAKRQILDTQAIAIADRVDKGVPASIFFVVAGDEYDDGNYTEAERLYLKALGAGDSTVSRLHAPRALAQLYFTPGSPLFEPKKGREQLAHAIEYLRPQGDEGAIFSRGFLYEAWGQDEWLSNDYKDGMAAFQKATAKYSHLSPGNPDRQASLDRLSMTKVSMFRRTDNAFGLAARLLGVWRGSSDVLRRTRLRRRGLEHRPIVRLVPLCLLAVGAPVPESLLTGYRRFLSPVQKQSSVPIPPSRAKPCRFQSGKRQLSSSG
jgi:hypothetical protein